VYPQQQAERLVEKEVSFHRRAQYFLLFDGNAPFILQMHGLGRWAFPC
jgi:hypothetical protein